MGTFLMAVVVVGAIQAIVFGHEMLDLARKQTVATQIIQGQLDYVRLCDWSEVNLFRASETVAVDAADQTANRQRWFVFGANLPPLSTGFLCTRTTADERTSMKRITYTVTWPGAHGRTYLRSGSTFVGRNGLYVTYQR